MSHLTKSGKKCKVGEKRELCIFHRGGMRMKNGRVTKVKSRRYPGAMSTTSSGKRRKRTRKVWQDLTGADTYKPRVVGRPKYLPLWDAKRGGRGPTSRGKSSRKRTRGTRFGPQELWALAKDIMKEITGVPFPGEPWR